MSGPRIHISLPPASLFKFPPDPHPPALPPPADLGNWASPFGISAETYNRALIPALPVTFALIYAVTVTTVNGINRRGGYKPWRISKTKPFFLFVLTHNILLAIYSAVTCYAMWGTMRRSLYRVHSMHDLAPLVDSLCQMHGPRGYGDAATYNSTTSSWGISNSLIHLGELGSPDPTDVGRIWNEGLAFWGWFFYLSKFYEVLDTAIILAKGKRSSTLQTYHHAGAMLCMWAGIRYMSAPIWIFCLVNSGIHTMMYTYYTVSALGVKVPQWIKRTLTSLQITQFVLGASAAALHLFVSYHVPVNTPFTYIASSLSSAASVVSSAAASALHAATDSASQSAASSTATSLAAVATGSIASLLKKVALRAAGEEGLAENVKDPSGHIFGQEAQQVVDTVKEETRWRKEWPEQRCISTSGQTFAVYLNVIYLLPLTILFVRFFIRSYTRRISSKTPHPTKHRAMSKSVHDAAHGTQREVESFGRAIEDKVMSVEDEVKEDLERLRRGETVGQLKSGAQKVASDAKEVANKGATRVKQQYESAKANGSPTLDRTRQAIAEGTKNAERRAREIIAAAEDRVNQELSRSRERAPEVQEHVKEKAGQAAEYASEKASQAKDYASEKAGQAKDAASETAEEGKSVVDEVGEKAEDVKENGRAKAQEVKEEAGKEAKDTAKDAEESAAEYRRQMNGGADQDAEKEEPAVKKEEENKDDEQPNGDSNQDADVKEEDKDDNADSQPVETSWVKDGTSFADAMKNA